MTRQSCAAGLADAVAVVAFVLIGRASHDEGEAVAGFLHTFWPFAVGLAVAWLVVLLRGLVAVGSAAGLVAGSGTAVVGLAVRAVSGQGVAVSFLVVAVLVLTAFATAWRVVWRVVRRGFSARRVADLP